MNAISIEAPGGPDVLRPADLPIPHPAAGEILVRTHAIGVNYIDVYYRIGRYAAPHSPFTPGMEAAGVVDAVGEGVTKFAVGDRVAYAQTLGSYAEYAVVPASKAVAVPEAVSFRDAAALMLQGMTAHYLVNSTFPLAAGQVAVVHAAAGGVGLLLVQLAKAKGARVIATVSTDAKEELARRAGADEVLRYEGFEHEVRRLTDGVGADVIYDGVGAATFDAGLDALRKRGMLVLYGAASGPVAPLDLQKLNVKGSLFTTRPTLGDYIATEAELTLRASELFAAVADGTLALRLEQEYPLAEAARAHRDLETRATTGKLLLIP
jgi:NADPH2:quinone reductase